MFLKNCGKLIAITSMLAFNITAMELLEKLRHEEDPNHAQKLIRMQLKGNEQGCMDLFKEAMQTNNVVAQLYLSNAYFAMSRSKDAEKDFNRINEEQLESYTFTDQGSSTLKCFMRDFRRKEAGKNWKLIDSESEKIICDAALRGNTYANILKNLPQGWNCVFLQFEIACRLKPFMRSPFPELCYVFGASLFNSSIDNKQFQLEGLKYMEQSGLLNLKFFEEENKSGAFRNFQDYCQAYLSNRTVNKDPRYYEEYGMVFVLNHINHTVLIPSQEHWRKFKSEYLDALMPNPDETFNLFKRYDMNKIKNLCHKYNLFIREGSESTSQFRGERRRLPYVLSISGSNASECGRQVQLCDISITNIETRATNEIILPAEYKELVPVIDFLKDLLAATCNAVAVLNIMKDLELLVNRLIYFKR